MPPATRDSTLKMYRGSPLITYFQAATIGLIQGISELFPISSLGHSVLVPAFIGGSWKDLVSQGSSASSETSP
jgi:undecaprenyl-diphosphatase